jgi:hypothetical protein
MAKVSWLTRLMALSRQTRRWEWLLIVVLLMVASFSWCRRLSGPIDLRYDASTYFVLGTSLAEGKGYRLLNEPGELQATQYPPLLPFIVAVHERVLGTSDLIIVGHWLRMTWFLGYLAFTLSVYFMLKRYLSRGYAFVGTLICLLSLYIYLMSNQLAPEVLFCLTSCLFFLSSGSTNATRNSVFAFLFATASYALRTIGIALFAAWVADALLRRRFSQAFLRLALSLVPIICWQSYIHQVESSHDYKSPPYQYQRAPYLFYNVSYSKNIFALKDSFQPEEGAATGEDITRRFLANLTRIPGKIGEAMTVERKCWLIPFSGHLPAQLGLSFLLGTIGCIVFLGIGVQLARHEWSVPVYVLLSVAAISLTPWPIQLVRYLTPLCPFFVVAFFTATRWLGLLAAKMTPGQLRIVWVRLLLLFGSIILIHQLVVFYRFTRYVDRVVYKLPDGREARLNVFGYFPSERALNIGLDWMMKEAGTKVVASSTPQWVYLRTGSKAVMPPFEINPEKAQAMLDSVPVTFLMLEEGFTKRYVSGVLQRHPELWREVYSNRDGKFKIYRRVDTS